MPNFDERLKNREVHLREAQEPSLQPANREQLLRFQTDPRFMRSGLEPVTPPKRSARSTGTKSGSPKQIASIILILVVGATISLNFRVISSSCLSTLAMYEVVVTHDLKKAAELYKAAYNANPADPNNLLLAASIHLGLKNDTQAFMEFEEGIKNSSNPAWMYNQRAKILNGQGRVDEALSDWTEAIKLKPDYFAARAQRAQIYMNRRQYALAIPDLEAAANSNPNKKDTWIFDNLAYCLRGLNRYKEALDAANKAIAINSSDTYAHQQIDFLKNMLAH